MSAVVPVETKANTRSNTLPPELKGRKVSEVFLEFANPLLRQIMAENPKLTAKECEFQLRVPWMVWNALVMKKKSDSGMDALLMLRTSLKDAPEGSRELVEILIERKKAHFSKYTYAIGNFEVRSIGDGDIRLYVEARSSD